MGETPATPSFPQIVIAWRPLEHISANSSQMVGEKKNVLWVTTRVTRELPFSAVAATQWLVTRPVQTRVCITDQPTFSLHWHNWKTLWLISVRLVFFHANFVCPSNALIHFSHSTKIVSMLLGHLSPWFDEKFGDVLNARLCTWHYPYYFDGADQ